MQSHDPLDAAKRAVEALDIETLARFAGWFDRFHSAAWDAQIARDFSDPVTLARFIDDRELDRLTAQALAAPAQSEHKPVTPAPDADRRHD